MSDTDLDEIVSKYNVNVTLAIGTGRLPVELDLPVLADALGVDFDPEEQTGVQIRPTSSKLPMGTFYRSGKYILRTPTEPELFDEQDRVLEKLTNLGVITKEQQDLVEFEVSNIVAVATLGAHFQLSPLTVGLGFDKAEYEPEQFPAMIYRNNKYECTFSVFSTGKIVFPGASETETALKDLDGFVNDELDIWM